MSSSATRRNWKPRCGEVRAALIIDREFVAALQSGQRQARLDVRLAGGDAEGPTGTRPSTRGTGDGQRWLSTTDDRARLAHSRLRTVFTAWEEEIARRRMQARGLPEEYHRPLDIPRVRSRTERVWSRMFPFLIVMMSLTGALYPAIDLCAGEKERGTMETLLISPASRAEIVWGKFLTVWLFSAVTALLNLASLGFTAWQFSQAAVLSGDDASPIPAPGLVSLLWCVVLMLPLSAFFSAVCLALAVYARSTKEGQYYLMPLMVVTLPLTLLSLAPGAELTPGYSILPVTGPALLLQALMNARTADQVPWLYLAPVLIPSAAYCYLALHWAIQQFNREEVLFREAERLDLRLWLRRLLREKGPLPSATMAVACFIILMFARWFISTGGAGATLWALMSVLQLAGVAAPALLMAILLTARPLATLRLRHAGGWLLLTAPLLALTLHPVLARMVSIVIEEVGYAEQARHMVQQFLDPGAPLALHLVVLALLPAVCEELAFRGFILTGLTRRLGTRKAILVSSLLFAIAHLNAFQFLPTFILGLVLGLLVTRSGSLLPGVLFHGLHNALLVTVASFDQQFAASGQEPPAWLTENGLYSWPVVAVSAAAGLVLLVLVSRVPPRPVLSEGDAKEGG